MRKLRWLLAPFAAGLIALTAACGGDDDNGAPGPNDSGSASGGGTAVSRELNLAEAATQLMELNSFRFDLSFKLDIDLEGLQDMGSGDDEDEFGAAFAAAFLALFSDISMSGAYVAPDSFDMEMSLAGEKVRYIQIGDEAWTNDGSGWVATTPESSMMMPFSDPTSFATEILPDAVLDNAEISQDSVNGVAATRYSFDRAALEAVAAELGEDTSDFAEIDEMQLDVWLIDGNIPVKFEVKASGTDAEGTEMGLEAAFEISDLNADIEIERPIP